MILVDSHCHLNYPEFADLPAVIDRAVAADVRLMQTISTKPSDFNEVKAISNLSDRIYCSIGIHPHEAGNHADFTAKMLEEAAQHPRVIAIGETGLDYYYEHSPRAIQIKLFQEHIKAARALDLPVIVHSRDADEDTIAILHEAYQQAPFKFLIHCFSTTQYLADKSIEIGGYISISGIITFKKSQPLRDIVASLPMDRLLVETDAPYLAPMPYRGKPNEPAYTRFTAEKLSEIKGVSLEALAETTTNNFLKLFTKATLPAKP
jgi:TatD DNase family protein